MDRSLRLGASTLPARLACTTGLLVIVAYYLVPAAPRDVAYDGLGLACAVALGVRGLVSTGRARAPWLLAALGVAFWVAGDVLSSLPRSADGVVLRAITRGDALYVLGYPVLALSIWRFAHLRDPTRDPGRRLEGLVLLIAATLPVYEFWIRPAIDSVGDPLQLAVSLLYPALDLALIASALRLTLGVGGVHRSGALMGAALLSNIAADIAYNIVSLHGDYASPSPIDALWLLTYVFGASAALHPSAAALTQPRPGRAAAVIRQRAVFVTVVMASPFCVVAEGYVSGRDLDLQALGVACAAMTIPLLLRLRQIAASGSTRWRAHALLFGTGLVALTMAVGVTHSRSVSDRRLDDAATLAQAEARLGRLGAAAADARADPRTLAAARRAIDTDAMALRSTLDQATREGLTQSDGARLVHALDRYRGSLQSELDLVAAGRVAASLRFDREHIDPAYRAINTGLKRTVERFRSSAATRARNERVTGVVLFSFGTVLLIVLLRLLGATRRTGIRAEERSQAVIDSERRFRALVAGSTDLLTLIDADTRVLAYPETVDRLLAQPPGTMLGRRLDEFLRDEDALHTRQLLSQLTLEPGASVAVDWIMCRGDGTRVTAEARIRNHLIDPHLQGFVLNVRDVTERRNLEHELEYRALHDHLTGLPNRALLEDRLRHALERSARRPGLHGVVMLDLRDFKSVNDALGHHSGDTLLLEISRRLGGVLRGEDTLARISGDQFAMLIEDIPDVEAAVDAGRRMLDTLADPFTIAGRRMSVTASVGVSVSDGSHPGSSTERVQRELANADMAMHEAKRAAGGSVELYAPAMHAAVTRKVQLRSEIEQGIEAGQFIPYFQPIVDLSSRRVVGFEALARWMHPERGLVPPAEFISVAEDSGLIVELGSAILGQAARDLAGWSDPELYVSVNVAGAQIQRDAIVSEVASAIRESGVEPARLLLEVTETSLIQDSAGNERRLAQLRELGVRLAIDDFGTGYSSLSYLQRFSMDVLKIDKSFVDPIVVGGRSPLVEAMLTMARALGLKVIAEGIETPVQMFALMERGCRSGQGYLFSKPMPPSAVEAYLAERTEPAPVG